MAVGAATPSRNAMMAMIDVVARFMFAFHITLSLLGEA